MFRFSMLFASIFTMLSCQSKPKHPPQDPIPPHERLEKKLDNYLQWSKDNLDEFGWIGDTKCDGLLFNSLYSVGGGDVDIELAQQEPGKWFRHAAQDCFETRDSASTISRDMFVGLFIWIWHNERLDLIESIVEWGMARRNGLGNWIMGEGDIFRITLRPPLKSTACEILERLGGEDHQLCRQLGLPTLPCTGYECHLQALHILLRGQILGAITDAHLEKLEELVRRFPRNALYQALLAKYTEGNMDKAIEILLDESLFPDDRLPESQDRCTFYLFQRDEFHGEEPNPDWLPCPEDGERFSGVDFIFTSALVLGRLKQ